MPDKVILTQQGYDRLYEELNFLKTKKRREVADQHPIRTDVGKLVKALEAGRHESAMIEIKRIELAADRMNALLNDLLELSRVDR